MAKHDNNTSVDHIALRGAAETKRRPRILCASDLTKRSDHALRRALSLSEALGGQCLLLHVVDDRIPLRLAGRRAERAYDALRWYARRHSVAGSPPETSVLIGRYAKTIIRVAKEWDADLIVMGSTHRNSFDRFGRSTAERVAYRTSKAVLAAALPVSAVDGGYSEVTFIAPQSLGAFARCADRYRLLDSARVAVIPPRRSLCDRIVGRLGEWSRHSAHTSLPPDTMRDRLERVGLTSKEFELVEARPTVRELLAELKAPRRAQLLVAGIDRLSWLLGSYPRSMAVGAMRRSVCDVLLIPQDRVRAPSRHWLPALQRHTCESSG